MEQDLKEKVQNQAGVWAAAKKSQGRKIYHNPGGDRAAAGNLKEGLEEEGVWGVDQPGTKRRYRS